MEGVCEAMETSVTPFRVVSFEEQDEDNGCDEDGLEATAAA